MKQNLTYTPQEIVLPRESWSRTPPRQESDRQPEYLAQFDFDTLVYDAFIDDRQRLTLICPPFLNLADLAHSFLIDGQRTKWRHQRLDRVDLLIARKGVAGQPTISSPFLPNEIVAKPADPTFFQGKRVLFTLQKNNDLFWIKDWLTHYCAIHKTNAVLIYDNGSSDYTSSELLTAVLSVQGVERAATVQWNFPYGPGGGPKGKWDSDFCQAGMFEHARRRFLSQARSVINADIDELVVPTTPQATSLHEFTERSWIPAVSYSGNWIAAVKEEERPARHAEYMYAELHSEACPPKWACVPSRVPNWAQWRTHSIRGVPFTKIDSFQYKHFRGISNGWKYRRANTAFNVQLHEVDTALQYARSRISENYLPENKDSD